MILAIIGIIVSAIISAVFSQQLIDWLGRALARIDISSKADIEGIWIAEFVMKDGDSTRTFTEAVTIKKRLGVIYGYNIPHQCNHSLLIPHADNEPIRLRANMLDNRFVTGIWYHPNRGSRYHGSFQLIIRTSGKRMEGSWTGYRESKNVIESDSWNWKKE